jgi:uncharacterized membrane protein YbhN (UPF0104 family)
MDEGRRRRLLGLGRVIFAMAIVLVLAAAVIRSFHDLRDVHLDPQPLWLLAAAPFTLAGGLLLPLAWRHVLLAYGKPLPRATAVRIWCVSQASRFVPGNVALVASRIVLTAKHGVPRALAGVSVGIETGLIIVWGGVYAGLLPSSWLAWPLRLLLAGACFGFLAGLPWTFRLMGRLLPRVPSLRPSALRTKHLYEAVGLYGMNTFSRCLGFLFVTASLHPIRFGDLFLVVAATNVGAVLGMVGITPAGLGVREGVIAGLLSRRFGLGNAAALAVAFRAWEFLAELVWLGVAHLWEKRSLDSVLVQDVPESGAEA